MQYKNIDSVSVRKRELSPQFKTPSRSIGSHTSRLHAKKSHLQKLTSAYLMALMIFQSSAGVFVWGPKGNEAKAANSSDWLSGYAYRTPVMIDNSNNQPLANYQTKITLQGTDPAAPNYLDFNKVLPGGADFRITDSDKVTQIPYWIESWDNTAKTATVWAKFPILPVSSIPHYFKFSTSQTNHDDYGLSYPVTYEFNIPSDSSNLKAYKKYTKDENWTQLEEKTSSDFFNGIEAVRFDYVNNKAYLSVAFDANSNDIYLKVVDENDAQIGTYQKIDKYYDNRQAAVVATADDWGGVNDSFNSVCDAFTSRHIWLSPAIATAYGGPMPQAGWNSIQSKINAGYIEPVSHSRTHSNIPYSNYDSEIGGSKTDIINNLNLPALNKKGNQQYIYGWIAPGGQSDSTARAKLGQYKYLSDRTVSSNLSDYYPYATWDSVNNTYNRSSVSIEADAQSLCGWAPVFPGVSALNNKFDTIVATGGIYTLYFHPQCTPIDSLFQHLDYIKEKTNLWYVGFGHLYLYNFTRERAAQRATISEQTGQNIYLYYGKTGVSSLSNYNNTFTKDYGESGLVGLWHMDEGIPGPELLTDGGLEDWTSATALAAWAGNGASAGVRDIAQETTDKQAGASALKLSATGNDGTSFGVYQDITTVAGQTYQVNCYPYLVSRTTGTLKIEAWDNTNSISLGSQSISAAQTAGSFTSFRFTSTNTASVRIEIYLSGETTSGTAYVDSLSVRQSSDTLTDASGNDNTGLISGASRTSTDGGQWGNKSEAVFSQGSALQFDGKDDYVNGGNGASLNNFGTGGITVGAWVYVAGSPSAMFSAIAEKSIGDFSDSSNSQQGFFLGIPFDYDGGVQNIKWGIGTGSGLDSILYRIPRSDLEGKWIHIVGSADDQSVSNPRVKLYVNGALVQSVSRSHVGSIDATARSLNIGRWSLFNRYFNGAIDEIRIYNRALSSDEIMAQYQRRIFSSVEPSASSFSLQAPSTLYKNTTNIISAGNDYIFYTSEPVVGNEVNSNMTFTPAAGFLEANITDTAAHINYANSTFPGFAAENLDRETDFHRNGTTSLQISPSSGTVNLSVNTWRTSDDYYKEWTEESTNHALITGHTIGDLLPYGKYDLKIDGEIVNTYVADSQGQISFTYSGGYSTHTFEIGETPASAVIFPSKPTVSNITITALNNGTSSINNLPSTVTQIAISTDKDFKDTSWEDISQKDILLSRYAGQTVYLKFRTGEGAVSDTITYNFQTNGSSTQGISTFQDGDIVKVPSSPDVYVIKLIHGKKYKRLLLSPIIFNSYAHLKWANVKTISEEGLQEYTTSTFVHELTDNIIYTFAGEGDEGKKRPVNSTQSYDVDSVYTINKVERDSYEWEE